MMRMIETRKLDGLLEQYTWKRLKNPILKFGEYVEGLIDEDGASVPKLVDSVGVVMRGDFEGAFTRAFIDEHFEDLAETWFKGLNSQVDFGATLAFVKEMFQEESSETGRGSRTA